jgi:hypothetical protein
LKDKKKEATKMDKKSISIIILSILIIAGFSIAIAYGGILGTSETDENGKQFYNLECNMIIDNPTIRLPFTDEVRITSTSCKATTTKCALSIFDGWLKNTGDACVTLGERKSCQEYEVWETSSVSKTINIKCVTDIDSRATISIYDTDGNIIPGQTKEVFIQK